MTVLSRCLLVPTVALLSVLPAPAPSPARNAESERLRALAFDLAYNLDREEAYAALKQAQAADPNDAAAYRAVAAVAWLDILFRRGVLTVDDYVGHLSRADIAVAPPPPELASRFQDNVKRAVDLAERQLAANPRSAAAHYNAGAAIALQTTYMATVEGRVLSGLRASRRAYSEHERVLELDPRRKDANLIVGSYRYVVAQLPLPFRLMAYIIGFGGGEERGLQMIEESAAFPSDVQADSKFLLILLYNREKRYTDALRVIGEMQRMFPRNRLLWLEAGATALRAGNPARAEASLNEGMTRLEHDARPRAFGEEAAWRYERGLARRLLGQNADAESDLRAGLTVQGREWVHGRTHLELGKLADLAGDRERARREYQQAITLCDADNDASFANEARGLTEKAFGGK